MSMSYINESNTFIAGSVCAVPDILDNDIIISELEHQSAKYVLFQTNTFEKGMNLINPLSSKRLKSLTNDLL